MEVASNEVTVEEHDLVEHQPSLHTEQIAGAGFGIWVRNPSTKPLCRWVTPCGPRNDHGLPKNHVHHFGLGYACLTSVLSRRHEQLPYALTEQSWEIRYGERRV